MKSKTSIVTVLVGPPCVGKSSYLKNIDYDFVISSDDIVEIITSKEGLQYHDFFTYPSNAPIRKEHTKIFKQLVIESKKFDHVVWDLTNLTNKSRKNIFKHYPQATFNAVEFVFLGFENSLLERNNNRYKQKGKYINESVMLEMFQSYEPVREDEGFKQISYIKFSENNDLKQS